jgi:superfamily II DNA or RNA helicase
VSDDLDNQIREKNSLLLDLQSAKAAKERRKIIELASRAAALERTIARILMNGQVSDAIINLVSAASCFVDARRDIEARRAFADALRLSDSPATRAEIERLMSSSKIKQDLHVPGTVFVELAVNIEGNSRLRRPQVEAYHAARKHFHESDEHAVIQLPVGCGKTGTMSMLPFGISAGRALVVAPNLEIARNLKRNFDYSEQDSFFRKTRLLTNGRGPTCAVLDKAANIVDCDASDYVVGNIQQIVAADRDKWLAQFSADYFDLVLFDEGHHNAAESWQVITRAFPKAKFASFTATPLRADGKKVEGKLIYRFPIAEAIRDGYIKNIATRRLEPIELSFVYEGEQKRYTLGEILKLREEEKWFSKGVALAPECNANIVNAAIQCMRELREGSCFKHQIIAVACSIDHAKAICSLFRERGVSADVLHSKLDPEEISRVRSALERQELDAVVQVLMLGEGADYPTLSVAAIFRPFRSLVPYVQFVGRIMRVLKQDAPNDPDNRGFIISHVGLYVDRWWEELRKLDADDQLFFEALANSEREFQDPSEGTGGVEPRRRFAPSMQVLDEKIEYFIQEHFLELLDAQVMVSDLKRTLELRGFDLDTFGITSEQLAKRLLERSLEARGRLSDVPVQPQRARQEARRRLDERVKSGAKQLLNALSMTPGGRRLVKLLPQTGANSDLPAAIVLVNMEIQKYLDVGSAERDLLTEEQLRHAHDGMDTIIDRIVAAVKAKTESGDR